MEDLGQSRAYHHGWGENSLLISRFDPGKTIHRPSPYLEVHQETTERLSKGNKKNGRPMRERDQGKTVSTPAITTRLLKTRQWSPHVSHFPGKKKQQSRATHRDGEFKSP